METDGLSLFEDLCRRINLDEETQKNAQMLLNRFQDKYQGSSEQNDEYKPLWPVCAVACLSSDCHIPLSQLLRHSQTRLHTFFVPLRIFVETLNFQRSLVTSLEKKYLLVTVLFEKYEQLFGRLFVKDEGSPTSLKYLASRHYDSDDRNARSRKGDEVEDIFRFGWYLFLVAKAKLFPEPNDFVNCLHLLLCVVNLLVTHIPHSYLRIPLADMIGIVDGKIPGEKVVEGEEVDYLKGDTLLYLCVFNHANYGLVKEVQDNLFFTWVKTLCTNRILLFEPAKIAPEPSLFSTLYLGGLLDVFLPANLKQIGNEYEIILYDQSDFDERLFVEHHEQLQSPLHPTPRNLRNPSQTKKATPMQNSYFNVPGFSIPPPVTPARAALAASDWLHRLTEAMSSEPGESLCLFLKAAYPDDDDPAKTLVSETLSYLAKFSFPSENARRQLQVQKLFFRMFEAIVHQEALRLMAIRSTSVLTSPSVAKPQPLDRKVVAPLVRDQNFRVSLLAASVEVALCSYRIDTEALAYPAVINAFDIAPYHFAKIIESVVRNERTLPRYVIKHLVRVEERTLEELAWTSSSPLWRALKIGENTYPSLKRTENVSGSPKQPKGHALSTLASPQITNQPPTPIPPKRNVSVDIFIRKAAHLAGLRVKELLNELSNGFEVTLNISKQVEFAFSEIMTQQTDLLQDRHLDQIMLSVVHGVFLVNGMNVSFKALIEAYLHQPQAQARVYRDTLICSSADPSTPTVRGDIIKFYNDTFLPRVESFLLEFEPETTVVSNKSPAVTGPPTLLMAAQPTSPFKSPFKANPRRRRDPQAPRSPQKIRNLVVSPRLTPLLFRNRSAQSFVLNSMRTPQANLENINSTVNRDLHSAAWGGSTSTEAINRKSKGVSRRLFANLSAADANEPEISQEVSSLSVLRLATKSLKRNREDDSSYASPQPEKRPRS